MSFILQYPGNSRLDKVADRIEMVGSNPSFETASSILDELVAAWESGLNFNGTIHAIRLFTKTAAYVTPPPAIATNAGHNLSHDLCRLAERSLAIARTSWAPFIGLLETHDAIAAWQSLDGLFAAVISGHLHEDVIQAGFKHIENADYPASATAAIIAHRLLTMDIIDSRLVKLVEFLKTNARFPQEMALASATEARLDYQLLADSLKRSGAEIDALAELQSMDESVSDTFGSEFFVDVGGDETRQVGELLTKRALATKAQWNIRDPFLNNYVEYIIGRIEAGAGNPDHARRVFEQMFKAGFAPWDSTIYIAYLATSEGAPDAARAAVENLVATFSIPTEFAEAFGTCTQAYRRAGGDPGRLTRLFPMERLVEECRLNRARIDAAFEVTFAATRRPALERFWREKTETLLKGIGAVLQASDFDSRSGFGSRTIRLPESLLVKACLDQLPNMSPMARQVFFEAGKGGAPVSEVISQLFDITTNNDLDFAIMARLVPAWAHSAVVATGRLETAIQSRSEAAVDDVLDGYIELDGVPSELLAELYGRVTGGDCCLVNREKVLLLGVRLWNASRGGSGARILKTLRSMSMELLADDSARGMWITALDAVLDTIPDDETRKDLCDWFLGRAGRHAGGRADPMLLSAGMVLAQRVGPPFDESVKANLRALVLAGDNREPEGLRASDLTARIVRLNQWCEGDSEADRMISDWFHRWVRAQGMKAPSNWEAIGDIASLAINRTGDDVSRLAVASTTLRLLKSRLGQPGRRKQKDAVLARVETLSDLLPEASELVETYRERRRHSTIRLYVGISLGTCVLVACILLIGYIAC